MVKSYQTNFNFFDKVESLFAPVNELMLINPEYYPTDDVEYEILNQDIQLNNQATKVCPFHWVDENLNKRSCQRGFRSEHAYQLHIWKKHRPQCAACGSFFKTWNDVKKHELHCSKKPIFEKVWATRGPFFTDTQLWYHEKYSVKPEEKPDFQCPLCEYWVDTKKEVKACFKRCATARAERARGLMPTPRHHQSTRNYRRQVRQQRRRNKPLWILKY